MRVDNLILGAGIAGLGVSYTLKNKNRDSLILEKTNDYGGLCGSFEIDGFRFDKFVHLSFTKNIDVNRIFYESCGELITHIPNPYNLYHNIWIKHPAQNNLFPLSEEEKKHIISDFKLRRQVEENSPANYEEWLRLQFGDYFAEHFPMPYTRKYWMKEARELRTEWVGERVYQPSVDEVIKGSRSSMTPNTYYAKEMRYPQKGGYKALLRSLADSASIRYNSEVLKINATDKTVLLSDGNSIQYDHLLSSLPLPMVIDCMDNVPVSIRTAAEQLEATCGYHISIALKTQRIPPYLWWYIYDDDIPAARVYSPSLKSKDNAPEGCSSLQMEVYCKKDTYSESQLVALTVGKLIEKGIIHEEDILFTHIGFEPYANVIFTEPIYEARKKVRDYLSSLNIVTFGRWGEWDYLWSDQSMLSGINAIN